MHCCKLGLHFIWFYLQKTFWVYAIQSFDHLILKHGDTSEFPTSRYGSENGMAFNNLFTLKTKSGLKRRFMPLYDLTWPSKSCRFFFFFFVQYIPLLHTIPPRSENNLIMFKFEEWTLLLTSLVKKNKIVLSTKWTVNKTTVVYNGCNHEHALLKKLLVSWF